MQKFTPVKRSDEFIQVGPVPMPGDSLISLNDASMVRDYIAHDFFDHVPVRTPHADTRSDRTQFGKGFHSHGGAAFERDMFAGAMLSHPDEDSWHAIVMLARYFRSEANASEQRIESRYRLAVVGQAILRATKEVRVIRTVGELTVYDIQTMREPEIQRKAYEKPLTPDECGDMLGRLERVTRRLRVS